MNNDSNKKGPIDAVNNLVNNTKGLYTMARRIGQVANAVDSLITTVSGFATGGSILGLIGTLAIGVTLLLSIFFILFGGAVPPPIAATSEGGGGGGGENLTCSSGDYAACLKEQLNVSVTGSTNTTQVKWVYDALAYASKSPGYKEHLMHGGKTLTLRLNDAALAPCSGYGSGANLIRFGPWTCGAKFISIEYLIMHESGHAIAKRDPHLFQSFPWSSLTSQDAGCYDQGFLKSYPLRYTCKGVRYTDITAMGESWAEGIADYAMYMSYNPGKFLCAVALTKFPNQCPNTYNWLKSNFFDNYDY